VPDAVDTVICGPDDGGRHHPKHVQQFTDKINCVSLHGIAMHGPMNIKCLQFSPVSRTEDNYH